MPEEKQVEDSKVEEEDSKVEKSEDSKEPEFEALSEEETAEAVGDLLKDGDEQQPVKDEAEETSKDEAEETSKEEETQVEPVIPIIDDELVAKYPVLRAYYGKPVTDIAAGYQAIVTKFMNKSNDFAKMQKELDNISLQDLGDMPDSVEKPEEFKLWLKDRDEKNRQSATVEPQVDIIAELTTRLPAGTDVKTLVDSWANQNAQRLFDNMGNLRVEMQSLYQNNPDVLYQEVLAFQNSQAKENEDEAVVRKAGHKKLQSDFKKARNSKKEMPNSNVQTISKEVKLTEEEEMLIRIGEIFVEE